MINLGINGFGRIGKCIFLQLLEYKNFSIKCLNATDINVFELQDYLTYDTTHKHNIKFDFKIISNDEFQINHHNIKLVSDRDAKKIDWLSMGCTYIIDATGAYLTSEKCKSYNSPYVIMSAPAKDNTKTFIYGVNIETYNGENIVSASSCTTNCIAPLLKILNDNYKINSCIFTTIHSTTASQFVVDVLKKSSRTNRSILNNIIPHTTGASSSVASVLPELNGKITGTSIRVPVVNSSLMDLNIELENTSIKLKDIEELLINDKNYKTIYDVSTKKLVSSDFITTTTPTILDTNASIDIGNGKFKLMVWYDNEWSYSAQLIRLTEQMYKFNMSIKDKYYIENIALENKGVVCRFDYNVPINKLGEITDDFRIASSIPTIKTILTQNPKYIILTSHFGRPKGKDFSLSLKFLIPVLEKYLEQTITFLENGISVETLKQLENSSNTIYLLENLRFHEEETNYEKGIINEELLDIYKNLGDVFICDAFGCAHRKHLSIYAMKNFNKPYGYGHLIKKELNMINKLTNNSNKKVLGIIGGNKISDKLPLIDSLKKIQNSHIFIAGGLAKHYKASNMNEHVMNDGYGSTDLKSEPKYIEYINPIDDLNVYDIGPNSMQWLKYYINSSDIIFWNGSLGVIEHEFYKAGSVELLHFLCEQKDKLIIIGGGETASLIKDKKESDNIYVSTGGGALLEYLQNKILCNKTIVGLEIFI
jgi:glyceraldehyde 3-phosphate dehydrogenase